MRNIAGITVAIATALLCGACGGSQDERAVDVELPAKEMSADDRSAVDAEARKILREGAAGLLAGIGEIPGVWIGIWDRERGVYVRGYGKAVRGGRDADSDDFVRIASLTKTFVATLVLQLVDEGKLRLEGTVEESAPALARRHPKLRGRTIAQLLSMTSGLPNHPPQDPLDPQRVVPPDEIIALALRGTVEPPGTAAYSNTNYLVLGEIAEEVSGRSIGDLVAERVVEPLGIDARLPPPEDSSLPEPASHGYATGPCWSRLHHPGVRVEQDADVTDWSVSAAGAAGAMYARFEDLGVWGASMFGNVLLSKRLAARRLAAGPVWYGLGIWKVGPWYGHFGDIAGWASFIGHDPDRGTTVAVVVNTCNLSEALASVAVRIAKRDQ